MTLGVKVSQQGAANHPHLNWRRSTRMPLRFTVQRFQRADFHLGETSPNSRRVEMTDCRRNSVSRERRRSVVFERAKTDCFQGPPCHLKQRL